VWRNVAAPVLWIAATESKIPQWLARHPEGEMGTDGLGEVRRRLAHVRNGRLVTIGDAAHMLHHDQPVAVAAHMEPFLAA
jgi:pimeloyl-ACP methyl ester carboxylesterase